MKLICIGRNYTEHIKELENEKPEHPVLFLKPDTAILLKKQPFFLPDFSNDVHHEVEILVKIKKVGKHIQKKFAHKYYDEIGLLSPSYIGDNNYRYYGDKEIDILQQILFYKELEFSLDDISSIINDKKFIVLNALQTHKNTVMKKKEKYI